MAVTVTSSEPRISGRVPYRSKVGIPARPEEVAERHLEESRHTFPEQEQEDKQHEGDCRETGHAHE